ncbi:molybdenum cofactor biosynthesis protein F-domain-containing protein [Aspergillus filifer]
MTTTTPGYVPVSEWPTLEALAVGYHEHLMPASDKLKGKRLTLSEYKEQVTIVMKLRTGQATVGVSGFTDGQNGQKRTWTRFSHASIDGFDNVPAYTPSTILYRYTPRDAYEHVYHNSDTFTWHYLSGTERGLADTEPYKMLKLDERLMVQMVFGSYATVLAETDAAGVV